MRHLTMAVLGLLGALFLAACDDTGNDEMEAAPPATPEQTPPATQ